MREIGWKICKMVSVSRRGQMGQSIMVAIVKARSKGKVHISGMMVQNIRVNGQKIESKALGNTHGWMGEY